MKSVRSTIALGVLAAGLVLSQQACAATTPQAGPAPSTSESEETGGTSGGGEAPSKAEEGGGKAPAKSAEPKEGGKAPKDPILAGKRQIVIAPVESMESIVVVDAKGRLSTTDGEAEHSMFVLTPVGGRYQIKTAKVGAGGEPSCMGIKGNGTAPLTVVAAACDAGRDGQLFTIKKQKAKDNGRPTYAISNRDAYLQIFPSGLIAEELGDAPLLTTYAFVDNGPSTLPVLG